MPKRYSSKELIKMIENDGWFLVRCEGSHHQFRHAIKLGVVTIPHPRKEILPKTGASILKRAGLK
jgi:predicted RNA binding protein YcfA (HicA-like mRNA interferase family)